MIIFYRNTHVAQVSIREYDVKRMLFKFLWRTYNWIQISNEADLKKLHENTNYVLKPDMLFGKRGKRWLLGINLNQTECVKWFHKYYNKAESIDGVDGTLDVFLAEKCVEVSQEYYLSFSQNREWDSIYFSFEGGVNVEENWDSITRITLPVTQNISSKDIAELWITDPELSKLIFELWNFYKTHGFVSLEFNPIAKTKSWELVFLDAVAKVDDCEEFLQKKHWEELIFPNNYGFKENSWERYIRELDTQTWASLKMKILNPKARIWTHFAGGGWSLVMTDSLGSMGLADEIGNYWECSGNPSREFTKEYTKVLLTEMLANEKKGKYLIIAWAIANFTHIDKTFAGIIDALEEYIEAIREQEIIVLVRRGWINEKKWLQILEDACKKLKIPAIITGSDTYMTDILNKIKL